MPVVAISRSAKLERKGRGVLLVVEEIRHMGMIPVPLSLLWLGRWRRGSIKAPTIIMPCRV